MTTDEKLLTRWRDGDKVAGEQLFDRHFETLFRFFSSKAEAEAEDLTQETLLACVAGTKRLRVGSRFKAYMFVVARRVLHAYYDRKRKSRDTPIGSLSVVDLAPTASRVIVQRQEERLLLEALRNLPLDYQIAVELHMWEELTGPEIAEVLELPEGTVRSRLRRARLQLEGYMRELTSSPQLFESTLTGLDNWAVNVRNLLSNRNRS